MRSDLYGNLEIPISRASALSHAVLFDGSFDSVYQIPEDLARVTARAGTPVRREQPGFHQPHHHESPCRSKPKVRGRAQ